MRCAAKIRICLKDGVLDTQGKTVAASLKRLGYDEPTVRVGKYIRIELEASDLTEADNTLRRMCSDLLVNPVVEDYSMEIEEIL